MHSERAPLAEPGHLLTADGVFYRWPHSPARTTLLRKADLDRLLSHDTLERVLAHRELTSSQIAVLWQTKNQRRCARERRRLAQRIRAAELEELCRDIGEARLRRVFRATTDPNRLFELLLAEAPSAERDHATLEELRRALSDELPADEDDPTTILSTAIAVLRRRRRRQ